MGRPRSYGLSSHNHVQALLTCLERPTTRADLDFLYHGGLPGVNEFESSIPSISRLLKTALPLQHLTLDFHFYLDSHLCIPSDSQMVEQGTLVIIPVMPHPPEAHDQTGTNPT